MPQPQLTDTPLPRPSIHPIFLIASIGVIMLAWLLYLQHYDLIAPMEQWAAQKRGVFFPRRTANIREPLWDLFAVTVMGFLSFAMAFPMHRFQRVGWLAALLLGYGLFNCRYLFQAKEHSVSLALPMLVVIANFCIFSFGALLSKKEPPHAILNRKFGKHT